MLGGESWRVKERGWKPAWVPPRGRGTVRWRDSWPDANACQGRGRLDMVALRPDTPGVSSDSAKKGASHATDRESFHHGDAARPRGPADGRTDSRSDARAGWDSHLRDGRRSRQPRPAEHPVESGRAGESDDVRESRPVQREDAARARAGGVVVVVEGRAHLDVQAAQGREVPRRYAVRRQGREVFLRSRPR